MLIEDQRTILKPVQVEPDQPIEQEDGYTFLEKIQAGFLLENTIGSYANNEVIKAPIDNTFNPWEHLTQEEKVDEVFVKNAMYANSTTELESIRNQVSKERESKAKLTGASGFFAMLPPVILDPINLIPIGGQLRLAYKSGKVLKGALTTAGVGTGVVATQEAILQGTQTTRTKLESAINITSAGILSGILGGSITSLNRARTEKAIKELEDIFTNKTSGSVGARDATTYEIKGPIIRKLLRKIAYDPLTRTLTSPSLAARKLVAELVETPIELDGVSIVAAETAAKAKHDQILFRLINAQDEAWHEYLKEVGSSSIRSKFDSKVLTKKEFAEMISKEIRNPKPETNIHVKNAAQRIVKEVYDPIKKDLIDLGMLPKDVKVTTAAGYLNRVWSKEKIAANLNKFIDTTEEWLVSIGVAREGSELGPPARITAEKIANTIMSSHNSMLPLDFVLPAGVKGPLKSRTFDIPDELIDDFLENDIEQVAARYIKQMIPDIEIVRKFGSEGKSISKTLDFTDEIAEITEDFSTLIAEAKTPKEALKLSKQRDNTIRDIIGMRDRIRGTYGVPEMDSGFARFNQSAKNLNFLRMMGGVTASSVPDFARLVMADGFFRAFGGAFRHLSRSLTSMDNLASDELRYWGIGTDAFVNGRGGRLQAISDINEYVFGNTKAEKGLEYLSNKMGQINLMNRWTGSMKVIHAIGMQTRVMDSLLKGKFDHRLFRLGISEADAIKIRDNVLKHGKKDGTAWVYNAKEWDDPGLATKWYQALKKESDRVVVVPGQEKPLFMSRELGKTVMQFKSFMMSATQRVTIAGLQGQDAHFIQGAIFMVGMGAMTYVFKNKEAGREVDLSPQTLIIEGIDRSGMLGILMEANNMTEKISAGNVGLRALFNVDNPASRYASRSSSEAFLGPTYGSLGDQVFRVVTGLTSGDDFRKSDLRNVRRLIPFQNLTGFRVGVDKIEESIGDEFNLR